MKKFPGGVTFELVCKPKKEVGNKGDRIVYKHNFRVRLFGQVARSLEHGT